MEEKEWIIDDFLIGLHKIEKKKKTEQEKEKDEEQDKEAT